MLKVPDLQPRGCAVVDARPGDDRIAPVGAAQNPVDLRRVGKLVGQPMTPEEFDDPAVIRIWLPTLGIDKILEVAEPVEPEISHGVAADRVLLPQHLAGGGVPAQTLFVIGQRLDGLAVLRDRQASQRTGVCSQHAQQHAAAHVHQPDDRAPGAIGIGGEPLSVRRDQQGRGGPEIEHLRRGDEPGERALRRHRARPVQVDRAAEQIPRDRGQRKGDDGDQAAGRSQQETQISEHGPGSRFRIRR